MVNDEPQIPLPTDEPSNIMERVIDGVLSKVLPYGGARTIFGEPVAQGERTVIPVGRVSYRFGFGAGGGTGGTRAEGEMGENTGSGGGGGGSLEVIPLGYIEEGPEGSRFVPIKDQTRIAVAALSIVALVAAICMIGGMRRGMPARGRHRKK